MAAEKGNKYWELRKKSGRKKKISSPKKLWELACDYFQWCEGNPWIKVEYKGKPLVKVGIPTARPFTWREFDDFLFKNGVINSIEDYKINKNGAYKDFSGIIKRIGDVMYAQKFGGAAVGAFNANLIARELGIKEQTETSNETKVLHEVKILREDTESDEID